MADTGRVISGDLPRPFGKYTLVRVLGRGAMGIVYEAHDPGLNRKVALKLMIPGAHESAEAAALEEAYFIREAQMCARLEKHPHIVTVYEAGAVDGRRYIAMEFLSAVPLSDWIRERRPSLRTQVKLLRDVARAVHHAHEGGVLHRDLKPKNVLIDAQGRPYVTDFGMAKHFSSDPGKSSTSAGMVVGTPSYMSPEQAQGLKKIDRRTDVYSLGAMLYEMLTGKPPFPGEMTIVALMRVVQDAIPTPSTVSPEWAASTLDKSVETACMRALSKLPDDRPKDALAFADLLAAWLGDATDVRIKRAFPPSEAAPAPRRRTALWISAGVLLLAGLGLVALLPRAPAATDWSKAADLLPLADPARDAVSGAWKREGAGLLGEAEGLARIEIPWRPAPDYDVRIVFSLLKGQHEVLLHLTRAGRPFVIQIGAEANTVFRCGDASSKAPRCLEAGRFHTATVRVREGGASLGFDGKDVLDWTTDWSTPAVPAGASLRDASLLGLGVRDGRLEVRSVQVVDVRGRGARSRP